MLQTGGLLNAFGNGVVLPFLIIYLHNVRGISLGLAGLAAATQSATALASGFLAGTLSDRIGPKRVLVGALGVMTVAFALMPLIRSPWQAFAVYVVWGAGSGSFWPSQSALLAGADTAGAPLTRVRAAAPDDEPRRGDRRRRGRLDRVGRAPVALHRPLPRQLRDVRRVHARARARARRRSCTGARARHAGAPSRATARSSRTSH